MEVQEDLDGALEDMPEGEGEGEGEGGILLRQPASQDAQNTSHPSRIAQAQPQQQPPEQGKGVEMQEDFDGALEDMPEGEEEGEQGSDADDQEDAEGEDRLDQTMGDVGDEGEVVDERLWGKDDKPEDPSAGKETLQSTKPLQVMPDPAPLSFVRLAPGPWPHAF